MPQQDTIVSFFKTNDPLLHNIVLRIQFPTLTPTTNYFESLVESIISQQLSVKAGDTIVKRFISLLPQETCTPETVLAITREELRGVGLSWNKADYIHNIARAIVDQKIPFASFNTLSDEEIINSLTTIKGIGRWTAEMFLMFTLGREDVFSVGDVGLQNAIQKLYSLESKPTRKQMEQISEKWRPYRTYAARILWRSLDKSS